MTSQEVEARIRDRMRRMAYDGSVTQADAKLAEANELLPLFDDLAYCYFIRPNGEILVLDALCPEEGLTPVTDPEHALIILRVAVEDDPALATLIPPRPGDRLDCPACAGSGRCRTVAVGGTASTGICMSCRGSGWLGKER